MSEALRVRRAKGKEGASHAPDGPAPAHRSAHGHATPSAASLAPAAAPAWEAAPVAPVWDTAPAAPALTLGAVQRKVTVDEPEDAREREADQAAGEVMREPAPEASSSAVQRKPVIGEAGDAYEREADAVADRVVGGLDAPAFGVTRLGPAGPAGPPRAPAVEAPAAAAQPVAPVQAMEEEEPEEAPAAAVQAMEIAAADQDPPAAPPPAAPPPVQRREMEEEPADSVQLAKEEQLDETPLPAVQAMEAAPADQEPPPDDQSAPVQRKEAEEEPDSVQMKEAEEEPDSVQMKETEEEPDSVQMKAEDEEPDSVQMKDDEEEPVQRASEGAALAPAPAIVPVPASASGSASSRAAAPVLAPPAARAAAPAQPPATTRTAVLPPAPPPASARETVAVHRPASPAAPVLAPPRAAPDAAPAPSMEDAAARAIASPGGGRALPAGTRGVLELRMGVDLGGVRVHDDPDAQRHAALLHARAFTHGRHIWLGRGESAGDLRLMAHEVTHVLQQDGLIRRKPAEKKKGGGGGAGGSAGGSGSSGGAGGSGAGGGGGASGGGAAGGGAAAPAAPAPAAAAPAGPAPAAPAPAGGGDPGRPPELIMPEPPEDLDAAERARLDRVDQKAGKAVDATTDLPPAEEQVGEARAAVEEPTEETEARAGDALVAELGERPAPSPEIEELCVRIRETIRAKRPPDEDSLVEADPEEMAKDAGGELNENVEGDAQRVQGQYDELQTPPAGEPQQVPEDMDAPPGPAETPGLGAGTAAPDAVPPEDVSLEADVADSEQRMVDAGMETEPAKLVEDGPIAEARAAHGGLEETAARDPQEVLAEQQGILANAQADMAALQASALAALQTGRSKTTTEGRSQQTGMVGSEEEMRKAASTEAQGKFDAAQKQVNDLLTPLPRTAMAKWDAGVKLLSTEFEQHLDKVQRWVDERHESTVLAVWDYVTGLPDWVTDEYDAAEKKFGDGVCDLIREISSEVNGVIAACETIIDTARTEIAGIFSRLPESLQGWAAEQQAQFGERLDGLAKKAQQTRADFDKDLTQKASQAVQDVRQKIHELREAAKGLIGRIADAINEFLDDPVKFIINGLLKLVGIAPSAFWALVNRIGEAIDQIADDPLGFANNLMSALGQGFSQFFDNIGTHLLNGLLEWLFSGLGSVGVSIPADFSLKSIITFFLQLMGLSWANIRKILAKHIGEENVALIEKAWELVSSLIEMGPEGLFELIKDQLDPANLLSMVLEAATEYLIEALIKAVTPRILLMFNPAGAILQAIEAIFRVLSWVFQNAARIFSLVETIVNGVTDLIAGNIGGMANAIEKGLAKLIPPVIDFLAGYLGLGDLPEAIADVIGGFQKQVLAIVDRIIGFLVTKAKGLLKALGLGGKDEEKTEDEAAAGDHVSLARKARGEMEEPVPDAAGYDEVRTAKEAQARKVEEKYLKLLEPGIKLHVRFTPAATDEKDKDLDFKIVIAPNDTVEEGTVAPAVPEPVAGLHEVKRPAPFDTVPGESHHVPAKGLGSGVGQFLKALADGLGTGEWKDDPTAQSLAARYEARGTANLAAAKPPGPGLSAIVLSPNAHTEAGGVHTVEGSGPVLNALASRPKGKTVVAVKRRTQSLIEGVASYLAVNPQIPSWRLFLADVRRALTDPGFKNNPTVAPGTVQAVELILENAEKEFMDADESSAEFLRDRLVDPTNAILDRAVKDAYKSGKTTVSAAMERVNDGTPAGRAAALSSLDGHFGASWRQFYRPIDL